MTRFTVAVSAIHVAPVNTLLIGEDRQLEPRRVDRPSGRGVDLLPGLR